MHQRLRRQDQHREGRDRERAKRQRGVVRHNADQHHRRHDEGALRGDLSAGNHQIGGGREQRRQRRPFLDRMAGRERRHQRERGADHEEHHARHDCHVIAGHIATGLLGSKTLDKMGFSKHCCFPKPFGGSNWEADAKSRLLPQSAPKPHQRLAGGQWQAILRLRSTVSRTMSDYCCRGFARILLVGGCPHE